MAKKAKRKINKYSEMEFKDDDWEMLADRLVYDGYSSGFMGGVLMHYMAFFGGGYHTSQGFPDWSARVGYPDDLKNADWVEMRKEFMAMDNNARYEYYENDLQSLLTDFEKAKGQTARRDFYYDERIADIKEIWDKYSMIDSKQSELKELVLGSIKPIPTTEEGNEFKKALSKVEKSKGEKGVAVRALKAELDIRYDVKPLQVKEVVNGINMYGYWSNYDNEVDERLKKIKDYAQYEQNKDVEHKARWKGIEEARLRRDARKKKLLAKPAKDLIF